jgi:hypothetical protein
VATGAVHQRTCSEAADSNAGKQTSAVWKPFDQNSDWHDVTETQSNSADDTVAQVQPPQLVVGETRQKNAGSVQKPASERDDSWALAIEPEAAKKSRDTQHKDADAKGQRDFGNTPAELLRQWHAKNAPGVNCTQRDL